MNGQEIFKLVKEKRDEIEALINPCMFVLNKRIAEIYKEIEAIQDKCEHEFENGVCKFCGAEEDTEE